MIDLLLSLDIAEFTERLSGYADNAWLLMLVLALATLISEDLACVAGGLLAAQGEVTLFQALLGCGLGIFFGDIALYGLGYWIAHGASRWAWAQRLIPDAQGRWLRMFDKYGAWWIALTRVLPGTRTPSYVLAGMTNWGLKRFSIVLFLAMLVWTPVIVGGAYLLREQVVEKVEFFQEHVWAGFLVIVLLVLLMVKVVVPSFTWRGRRQLLCCWKRLTCWEFWPLWAVYPPVLLSLVWQGVRLRGMLLFTACNPGIPASGFAMESKGDILKLLGKGGHGVAPARWEWLQGDVSARRQQVLAFLERDGAVVLKPDVGERGQGVAVLRTEKEVLNWLDAFGDARGQVQQYVGGIEFGVAWHRYPGVATGTISSVVGKHPQHVTGDGVNSLEHLILADERAVTMLPYYLKKFAEELHTVPAAGEKVMLTELGTHARGAVFTDERSLITEELERAFDEAVPVDSGLCFGRFDVRVPDEESFRAGRNVTILEFNGVTGEPAHIYQPGYPWWRGICDLMRHWKTACEIGAAQQKRGVTPCSLSELIALVRSHKQTDWHEADEFSKARSEA